MLHIVMLHIVMFPAKPCYAANKAVRAASQPIFKNIHTAASIYKAAFICCILMNFVLYLYYTIIYLQLKWILSA